MWKLTPEVLYGGAFVLFLLWLLSVKGSFPKLALGGAAIFLAALLYSWNVDIWAPIARPGWMAP